MCRSFFGNRASILRRVGIAAFDCRDRDARFTDIAKTLFRVGLETASELGKLADEALKLVPSDNLWLAPTTGLEYLPHDVATKKLAALAEAARGGVPA